MLHPCFLVRNYRCFGGRASGVAMVDELGTLAGCSLSLKIVETSGEIDIAASGATSVSNRRAQLRPGAHLPH
jgi:hypothetical protein